MSLVLRKESGYKASYPFAARVGAIYFINKRIFPEQLLGNSCSKRVYYVKVKKAFRYGGSINLNNPDYISGINSTDLFANIIYSTHNTPSSIDNFYGTRLEISKCQNEISGGVKDLLIPIIERIKSFDYSRFDKFNLQSTPSGSSVRDIKANMSLLQEKLTELNDSISDCNIDTVKVNKLKDEISLLLFANSGFSDLVKGLIDSTTERVSADVVRNASSLSALEDVTLIIETAGSATVATASAVGTIAGPAAAIEIALTPINIAKSIDILTVK